MAERIDFTKLEAIYAYDTGSRESGIKDEALRSRLVAQIDAMPDDAFRLEFSRWLRDNLLSEQALAQGYGFEDVMSFARWIFDGDFRSP